MSRNTELQLVAYLKLRVEVDEIKWLILHYLKVNPLGIPSNITEKINNYIGSPEEDVFFKCERWEYIEWEVIDHCLFARGYFKNYDNEISHFLKFIEDCIECNEGDMIGTTHIDGKGWFEPIIYPYF